MELGQRRSRGKLSQALREKDVEREEGAGKGGVMQVHILTHEYRPFRGGIAYYVEELGRACARLGIGAEIWAPGYGGEGWEESEGVRIRRVRMAGKQGVMSQLALRSALRLERKGGLDTVVLAEPGPIRLWMRGRYWGIPEARRLVLVLHGTEVRVLGRGRTHAAFGALLDRAAVIGVVSVAVEDDLRRLYPTLKTEVVRVPGAVRSDWAALHPEVRPRREGPLRILQVGRIHPRKGQDLTLEAVSLLSLEDRKGVEVRCVGAVGRASYYKAIRRRIAQERLPVEVSGPVEDRELEALYRWADLAIFPSKAAGLSMEGLGLAALEASHFGLPVIASRLGGIPEAVQDGVTGRLVEPNGEDLKAALVDCLKNRERYRDYGQSGALFVRECFSWERNVEQLGLGRGISTA